MPEDENKKDINQESGLPPFNRMSRTAMIMLGMTSVVLGTNSVSDTVTEEGYVVDPDKDLLTLALETAGYDPKTTVYDRIVTLQHLNKSYQKALEKSNPIGTFITSEFSSNHGDNIFDNSLPDYRITPPSKGIEPSLFADMIKERLASLDDELGTAEFEKFVTGNTVIDRVLLESRGIVILDTYGFGSMDTDSSMNQGTNFRYSTFPGSDGARIYYPRNTNTKGPELKDE